RSRGLAFFIRAGVQYADVSCGDFGFFFGAAAAGGAAAPTRMSASTTRTAWDMRRSVDTVRAQTPTVGRVFPGLAECRRRRPCLTARIGTRSWQGGRVGGIWSRPERPTFCAEA